MPIPFVMFFHLNSMSISISDIVSFELDVYSSSEIVSRELDASILFLMYFHLNAVHFVFLI